MQEYNPHKRDNTYPGLGVSMVFARVSRGRWAVALSIAFMAVAVVAVTKPARAAGFPETLTVDSANTAGTTSTNSLQAFATYLINVSGTYQWNGVTEARDVADAECSTHGSVANSEPGWQRYRAKPYTADTVVSQPNPGYQSALKSQLWDSDPASYALHLYVDNRDWEWIPVSADGNGCNSFTHAYYAYYSPPDTRPINFRIYDLVSSNNSGNLTVTIEKVADPPAGLSPSTLGTHVETALIRTEVQAGSSTSVALRAGGRFLLLAHGMYQYGPMASGEYPLGLLPNDTTKFGNLADAQCSTYRAVPPDPINDRTWRRHLWLNHPYAGADGLAVHVDGAAVDWQVAAPPQAAPLWPLIPGDEGNPAVSGPASPDCDGAAHYYALLYTGTGSTAKFTIPDSLYTDNYGILSIEVFEIPTSKVPPPPVTIPPVPTTSTSTTSTSTTSTSTTSTTTPVIPRQCVTVTGSVDKQVCVPT